MAKAKKAQSAAATNVVALPQAAAGPLPPATYVNHAHVSWADGVVRLTLSEQAGERIEPRSTVLITRAQASALADLLRKAAEPVDGVEGE